ncbi:MAG: D-tyrosyl-tRNA(Tyr) deacylase [Chloroflexi bacterium]|nr:MAG: D-tyrosyl-tRNA(Tyr) deacylase [Chloroflexota bacterium]TMF20020.1 MAG: D-tyrosyl-tRNA(Tyr) deacylase [Chloroflexota bacterium]TMG11359.1 MAG: D-tyrosyl-tRNA(Tyr) deacylase [Chloroflexota bacterium]TMG49156.1 MAG: D-tyrosyl-tRNA(Tyr) deacylase [Chloroflexota bacterium]
MRAVVQRVSKASVRWDGGEASIGPGYCLLVGVADTDQERDADYLADKILKLRVFSDDAGKFNLSAAQVQAALLVVSQFTLFADARGQNRPSFLHAARPEQGQPLLERFITRLRASGLTVETGSFGAQMAVELVNDGPVTLVLSTDPWEPRIG